MTSSSKAPRPGEADPAPDSEREEAALAALDALSLGETPSADQTEALLRRYLSLPPIRVAKTPAPAARESSRPSSKAPAKSATEPPATAPAEKRASERPDSGAPAKPTSEQPDSQPRITESEKPGSAPPAKLASERPASAPPAKLASEKPASAPPAKLGSERPASTPPASASEPPAATPSLSTSERPAEAPRAALESDIDQLRKFNEKLLAIEPHLASTDWDKVIEILGAEETLPPQLALVLALAQRERDVEGAHPERMAIQAMAALLCVPENNASALVLAKRVLRRNPVAWQARKAPPARVSFLIILLVMVVGAAVGYLVGPKVPIFE